jgi:serine/threonine-protein kinase
MQDAALLATHGEPRIVAEPDVVATSEARVETNGRLPDEIAPNDATLDAPPQSTLSDPASDGSNGSGPRVHIVEGSGPGLSCEMRSALRGRLRIAALVLYAGFTAFWLWWTIEIVTMGIDSPAFWPLYVAQIGVGIVLGVFGLTLCRKCEISTVSLRTQEMIIFGLPAAFFLLAQVVKMPVCAELYGFVHTPAIPWLMLIFTYAMFIPNNWQRAAAVIGTMAATPIFVTVVLWYFVPVCHSAMADHEGFFVELTITMGLAAAASVIGVHTIGTLRVEAFKARQLGQYNLRHLIGAGGMGEVYLAEHKLLKRPCAIKLIRPDKAGDPKILARFEREVRATAKLSHWNSVEIFDYGHAEDGTFYYVMEYLPGMNLQELVARHGPLPPERVIHLLTQTCDALGEAHESGMLHRDIKPANIFAAQRGGLYDVAKLLDFGLVKPMARFDDAHLTQEGSITGSPLYMSPEQSTGDSEPDARSDIYCLGAVGYFLLSGRPPFNYEQPIKVLLAHAREVPPSLSELQGDVPSDLEAVVMKCLEKDPADRYQNVLELRDALLNCESAGHWTRRVAQSWWQANSRLPENSTDPTMVEAVA